MGANFFLLEKNFFFSEGIWCAWKQTRSKQEGHDGPVNAHLSIIALWEPDLELIKANILIKIKKWLY